MANPKQGKLLYLTATKYTKQAWFPTPTISIHKYKAGYFPAWGPQRYEKLVAAALKTTADKISVSIQEWPKTTLEKDESVAWLPGTYEK